MTRSSAALLSLVSLCISCRASDGSNAMGSGGTNSATDGSTDSLASLADSNAGSSESNAGSGGGNTEDASSADSATSAADSAFTPDDAISPPDDAADVTYPGPSSGTNTARPFGTTHAKNGFWEYLPEGYGDGTLRPLLVFWHGAGQDSYGNPGDLDKVQEHGPPNLIRANQWPASRPFVVLSPQHDGTDSNCPVDTEIHDFLAFAVSEYKVDPKRVYMTALSCGAYGAEAYYATYGGDVVAATVLIAGGDIGSVWSAHMCGFLSQTALWVFHGDADLTVPITFDDETMPSFLACPKPPKTDARYTVYHGVGHNSWARTYDSSAGHDIYTWMLSFNH